MKPNRKKVNADRAASAQHALKNLKNDLLRHKSLTANAVRQLVDHGQTCEGAAMQIAADLGQLMAVVDALVQHLGCEAPVRAILEKARAERDAERAAREEKPADAVAAPAPEVPLELVQ